MYASDGWEPATIEEWEWGPLIFPWQERKVWELHTQPIVANTFQAKAT